MKTLTTVRLIIKHENGRVIRAQSRVTGRFVHHSVAQRELDAHLQENKAIRHTESQLAAVACAIVAACYTFVACVSYSDVQQLSALIAIGATFGALFFDLFSETVKEV